MQPPFPLRFALAPGPHQASFHATGMKIDLSSGLVFMRSMAGFHGMGTVEVVPAGVRVVARRYRYGMHIAASAACAAIAMVLVSVTWSAGVTDPAELEAIRRVAVFWGVVAAVVGLALAALCSRFFAPVTALLDRARIQHVQMLGPRLRVLSSEGDVELWIPKREDMQGFVHALVAAGIAMR